VSGKIYCKDCAASGAFLPKQQKNNNGLAITSMILGILSLPLTFCYGGGLLLAIVAVITGSIARKQIENTGQEGSSQAKTGLITGWISIGLFILAIVVITVLLILGPIIGNVFTKINNSLVQ